MTLLFDSGVRRLTPDDDLARIVTSVQMLLDVVIGAVVRLLTTVAETTSHPSSNDNRLIQGIDAP